MSHDCVKTLNEQLAQYNTQVAGAISFSDPSRELIQVVTAKADPRVRGKPRALFASFCPFCGVSLKGTTE